MPWLQMNSNNFNVGAYKRRALTMSLLRCQLSADLKSFSHQARVWCGAMHPGLRHAFRAWCRRWRWADQIKHLI